MNKKSLLAFDCSGAGASITLQTAQKTNTVRLPQGQQATALVPAIDQLIREACIGYGDLAAIITTVGPGSFTGLRIGLAALHGLVLVNHTPLKILTSLEALAWHVSLQASPAETFSVALKVGKGELAAQEFHITNSTPAAMSEVYRVPEAYNGWPATCFGNHAAADAPTYLDCVNTETLCSIAAHLPEAPLTSALPFYIRPPDAAIPKPHAWLAS